ncbi:MAG: hypothetical protein NTZ97_00515 [Candidatus Moranbacteria bacterium]|nr:hypothetical protein [Candidatus Moranbacteria bacterium]
MNKLAERQRDMKKFFKKFNFKENGKLLIGVERECFIVDNQGKIIPYAAEVLKYLPDRTRFGYELSACQLEDRIGPVIISEVRNALLKNERCIAAVENKLDFRRLHIEIAPEDMPLDIFPDPSGRYQKITKNMPINILLAACRVTGTHIHIGMPDYETALAVYNIVINEVDRLCQLGDGSKGERLRIYAQMAPDWQPLPYDGWFGFYEMAKKKGFENDPRKCWSLIRISVHGTIEFRMFGATKNIEVVSQWAEECYRLCKEAMR